MWKADKEEDFSSLESLTQGPAISEPSGAKKSVFTAALHTLSSKLRNPSSYQTFKMVCWDLVQMSNSFSLGLNFVFFCFSEISEDGGKCVYIYTHMRLFAYVSPPWCSSDFPYLLQDAEQLAETHPAPSSFLIHSHQSRVVVTSHNAFGFPTPH